MAEGKHGLYGSDAQRRLQAAALAAAGRTRETPGAVFAARMAGTEDPERFGWGRIDAILRDEGAITFRMIPVDECSEVERRLAQIGCAIAWWDVFEGSRNEITAACGRVLVRPRDDLVSVGPSAARDGAFFVCVQAFMTECGVAPFPAQVLSGSLGPAALAVLANPEDGSIAATAFAYFPYNRHSAHRVTAWAGLVAVREDLRNRGIGVLVNALALQEAVNELEAERVQEYARTSNVPSCRMIERCGLRLRTDVRSGIAQPVGAGSFTR
jgi:GNAT superfamily N-acetyltransferase